MTAPGVQVAPYGSWSSPISADDVAAGSHPVGGGRFVGDEIWWLELRPSQAGRYAVLRRDAAGKVHEVLPAPWDARTRVHEYGGGAWTLTAANDLVFAEFSDQRLYLLHTGDKPQALTAAPPEPAAWRYGELQIVGDEVWCVREVHDADGVHRDLAAVPLDGSAADDPSRVRSLVGGSHFLAGARLSPDGTTLAWIAWEHPQMPWDGTELRVAELQQDATFGPARTLMGSAGTDVPPESVLQPEWTPDGRLYAVADRTGFWNLHEVPLDGTEPRNLYPVEAEVGGPLWTLGLRWYTLLDDGTVLAVRTLGTDTLVVIDPASGTATDVDLPGVAAVGLQQVSGRRALLGTGGSRLPRGIRLLDLDSGALSDVRLEVEDLPDPKWFAEARLMTFTGPGGRDVHAVVYPPTNPDVTAPEGELPPFVAWVHGGPTSRVAPAMSPAVAYWTSRGIGLVDVNYGGSTGYGREYRERLRGGWGVVDVEDTVAVVRGLVDAGMADTGRLAIEGGSAGGWTVLSCLTRADAFACGVSYFGVTELIQFAAETHDFESRYLDGLIGPLPEARELYDSRAPVNNVDGLTVPVLVLQGLDDPIVPPSQAERFVEAVRARGVAYAYRTYAGESHGFRRRETVVDALESSLAFYGQVMGFDPPGVTPLELQHGG
ncbi:S9 family peptidase [Jatrophihabitans sp. YIM 134969]